MKTFRKRCFPYGLLCATLITLPHGACAASRDSGGQADTLIRHDNEEGTYIDLRPVANGFPRSDINFGNWVLGQYSGIGNTDFFLYNGLTHNHPFVVSPNDEIIISHAFENAHLADAYDKLPSPLNIRISYGRDRASDGTAIGVQSTVDIYNEAAPTHGHNEFSAYYAYVRANNHGVHPPGQHYWVSDFHLATPYAPNPSRSPELEVVSSGRIINMSNGVQALSPTHMGAYGQSLVATPLLQSELKESGIPLSAQTYPVTALLDLAGFSGSAQTYSGVLPSAAAAAAYAIRIGGGGGSPYIPFDARSNFTTGIGVYDWSSAGLEIDHRLPNAQGPGLRNRYATELGGQLASSDWPYSLILHDEHPFSRTQAISGVQLGDSPHAWLMGNTQGSFSIAYQSAAHPALTLTSTSIGFFGHSPVSPPKLHPKFDLSRKIDPRELAEAYNMLHDALVSLGLAQ